MVLSMDLPTFTLKYMLTTLHFGINALERAKEFDVEKFYIKLKYIINEVNQKFQITKPQICNDDF